MLGKLVFSTAVLPVQCLRLTGTIPLVKSVGYVYPLLFCVFAKMFCKLPLISRPIA
jgi:hypothetical protein